MASVLGLGTALAFSGLGRLDRCAKDNGPSRRFFSQSAALEPLNRTDLAISEPL